MSAAGSSLGGGRRLHAAAALLAASAMVALAAPPAAATRVETIQVESQKAFLAGTFDGISVDPTGRLELADRAERVTAFEEPFLFAAANHPEGWVVGTGNAGKVLLVTRDGEVRELFAAPEGQVFAVWADDDGTVYAGASPGGKVYRVAHAADGAAGAAGTAGEPEAWFESGETYVWALARDPASGDLLVATGTSGKLFRVGADGSGRLAYDSDDTHVRALLPRADGSVVFGTAGEGLILELAADGTARTLYDAAQPEVVALAAAPDGGTYAAVIASEASQVDLSGSTSGGDRSTSEGGGEGSRGRSGRGSRSSGDGGDGNATVTVSTGASTAAGSRPSSFTGARSEVLRLTSAGLAAPAWEFDDETIFDLAWLDGRLWVATGLEGKLYSFDGEQMVLEKDLDERQVMALLPAGERPAFATTNAAALYRLTEAKERTGTYTSAAFDAGQVARFGTLRWRGAAPGSTRVEFSFRSGMSADPDRTWSPWTEPRPLSAAGEVSLDGVPRGRYLQWRARLAGRGERSPRIDGIEISYRQENAKPVIESFRALPPGQILVPAGFNPGNQAYEPAHPNRDGIFTTIGGEPNGDSRQKTLWKKGYRSFRWDAEDTNDDELEYRLDFRPAEAGAEVPWLPVAEELDDDHYSFDATVLPDGVYRFRLTASDEPANPPGEGLAAEQTSELVVVDHTPPRVGDVDRAGGGRLQVEVEDALNPLVTAEVSYDAGTWQPLPAADGLLDGRRETLELTPPADAHLVLLRLTDAAFNVVTHDLSEHLAGRGRGGR